MASTPEPNLYDVFLSYSSEDRDLADRIQRSLADRKLEVFRDARSITGGDNIVLAVGEGLAHSQAFIVLISPAAMASRWVEHEWATALWLSLERGSSMRIIPVIIARGAFLPALLRPFRFVDFRPPADFDRSLEELASAITGGRLPDRVLASRCPPVLSFLRFFPEGLFPAVYQRLVASRSAGSDAKQAEEMGIVQRVSLRDWDPVGLDPIYLQEIWDHTPEEAISARDTLELLDASFEEDDPFDLLPKAKFGFGRALLLRDLVGMVASGGDEVEDDDIWDRNRRHERRAREALPLLIEEGESRMALEISGMLLRKPFLPEARDFLAYGRALAGLGRHEDALEIFELYRGESTFDESSLSLEERLAAFQDWAKAVKDAGQARGRHSELVTAYGEAIALLQPPGTAVDEARRGQLADLFFNRGTQLAVFGEGDDWLRSLADLHSAEELYRQLGDHRGLLVTWGETVAYTLDRLFAGELSSADLPQPLATLERHAAELPAEDLFFFLYQKARLLRHLARTREAEHQFLNAEHAALQGELPHRAALARIQVARLRKGTGIIAADEFELELRQATSTLAAYSEDAWSRNALRRALPELARLLAGKPDREAAARCALQALALELSRMRGEGRASGGDHLEAALSLVEEIQVDPRLRSEFLAKSKVALHLLLGKPAYDLVLWDDLQTLV
jgi:tetratricopeptide (TPR) repeat protein